MTEYIFEKESNDYVLSIDVPGIKKDEIKLKTSNSLGVNKLHVKAENKSRCYSRVFSLANEIDEKNIKASLVDGVLKIKLGPKEDTSEKEIKVD